MHRKSKSTAGHAMNVTNLITFSKGYQKGGCMRRVLQSSIVLVLVIVLVLALFKSFSGHHNHSLRDEDEHEHDWRVKR
jgi:hypothetical protein